jgi:hypothetical protein
MLASGPTWTRRSWQVGARSAGLDVALLDRKGAANEPDCAVIADLWGLFELLGD